MNKRIEELIPRPWTFPYPDREMYSREQMEQFAELLISEVMIVVRDEIQYQYDWTIADIVTERVKKEFGV